MKNKNKKKSFFWKFFIIISIFLLFLIFIVFKITKKNITKKNKNSEKIFYLLKKEKVESEKIINEINNFAKNNFTKEKIAFFLNNEEIKKFCKDTLIKKIPIIEEKDLLNLNRKKCQIAFNKNLIETKEIKEIKEKEFKEKYDIFENAKKIKTKGDGNCFWNSVSSSLFGTEDLSNSLRAFHCLKVLSDEKEIYFRNDEKGFKNLKEEIISVSSNFEWTELSQIYTFCESIKLNLRIFFPLNSYLTSIETKENFNNKRIINIYYDGLHFEPLVFLND